MALDGTLLDAYNAQITLEFASAHQYLALAAWLDDHSYPGMAQWMQLQADEERDHAMRFFQFVLDRDAAVTLGAIDAPDSAFETPLVVFRRALAGEQQVTASINDLYRQAVEASDYASIPLLDWFVNEQVEEEATIKQIIDDLARAEGQGHAMLMIDRELGVRQPQ